MRRRRLLILLAVLVIALVGLALARYLTIETRERDQVYGLLRAQARGDARAMLARLDGCASDARCVSEVRRNARALRRPGEVKILAYGSSTRYALGADSGPTRVAWAIKGQPLPVVQCVEVRREGSVLSGRRISLRRLSRPIDGEGSC